MRATPNLKVEQYRIIRRDISQASGPEDGNNGVFIIPFRSMELRVIVSDQWGWDHVSVSLGHRCPAWEEMCFVKELFFRDDECVMQLHPPKADYVNNHPTTLHLWRPNGPNVITKQKAIEALADCGDFTRQLPTDLELDIPRPPAWMVGPAGDKWSPEEAEAIMAVTGVRVGVAAAAGQKAG